ncbi:MAG: DUF1697 domain-containing protein [Cytophagales bacterium]|nr:MAG: DUF1697 domain-containing protein [Cytophagales bacterium]TAF62064.1 MAG: DUF1697 domain-containing protein [Cytophagales bacterium]
MASCIALLRGINVSGQKKILMKDLTELCQSLGFSDVRTYIQSGNVLLDSNHSAHEVSGLLAAGIKQKYGFEVCVVVKTPSELQEVLRLNPFLSSPDLQTKKLYYTILSQTPDSMRMQALLNLELAKNTLRFVNESNTVYMYLPDDSYGNTKLSNNFIESKLKLQATTRNEPTLQKLVEMSHTN